MKKKPFVLIILDGWGHRVTQEDNAIDKAHTPTWDKLQTTAAHTLVSASGLCVGLPEGQMGNSEVGHLNIGAGRIVYQDLTRIDTAIADGCFYTNPLLRTTLNEAKLQNKAVHVLGLLSPGGVHSHENHLHALIKLASFLQVKKLYFHVFLDGRDTPPKSALSSLVALLNICKAEHTGEIISIVGRYYAMDRDKRWERTEKAYNLIVSGQGEANAPDAITALKQAYERGEIDEFVIPTCIGDPIPIADGDSIIFMNFRADRARQLTEAFINPDFTGFLRHALPKLKTFVSLTQYDSRLLTNIAFPPQSLDQTLAQYLSQLGLKQLHIAETEKYAHVTFFFNGGIEQPYPLEERILIPSPKIPTYDLKPEMSAHLLTERLVSEIKSGQFDFIVCNFANADMVGHTGNFNAAKLAIETLDQCLNKILNALKEVGGEALITADHGNAEQMYDPISEQPHTAHTSCPVPCVYVGRPAKIIKTDGKLCDIAPTILYLMGIKTPPVMTGKSLVDLV